MRWPADRYQAVGVAVAMAMTMLLIAACAPAPETVPAGVSGLRVNTVLGGAGEGFARAEAPRPFHFPADHGAHPAYRSEWWYITAVLNAADGREFGLQFTLFRQALTPAPTGPGPWQTGQAFLAHLAVTDVAQAHHQAAQRFARGHAQLAGVVSDPALHAHIEDWSLSEERADPWQVRLLAADADLAVDMHFTQTRAPVLQGDHGLSRKGPGAASYYYSLPRMSARGSVRIGGQNVPVTGLAWLDREWGTSILGEHLTGWDWFALQLDDGRDLMLFQLRRRDGLRDPFDYAVVAGPEGRRVVASADFQLTPERLWRDPQGGAWPVGWSLRMAGETFTVDALVDDQLMDLGLTYWEGLVAVRQGDRRVGRGYLELTGYENPAGTGP